MLTLFSYLLLQYFFNSDYPGALLILPVMFDLAWLSRIWK